VEGIAAFYGQSVFHCPYCDGWEKRGQPLVVYGNGPGALGLSRILRQWSPHLALCTDGPTRLAGP
jgi:thioredoxin reductase